ncbi:helix-turn-helix domain-containing protein [Halobacillus halophilus]|uniref:helix-turn-helix domain-containing protein n=1 Tax=Halobacillus halophilus TaxID=1570 RepID=UPI001CD47AF1|nr:RodZ family helix-turn-helix domain-containing protein [Halobacillus halophilus]MCA1009301.1 helix-turn-helix domain-containing protein [Halobacillus halophilus]
MEKEIGARLRNARESKGLSLEQVQETTKIKTRYLHAIEENDFSVLPGKFYTRAFIREYASAVGIDPEEMMEEHKDEMPSFEKEEAAQYKRVQKQKEPSAKRTNVSKYLPTVMTFVLVIGLLFVAYTFIKNGNNDLGIGAADQEVSDNDINVPEASDAEDTESTPVSSDPTDAEDAEGQDGGEKTSSEESEDQESSEVSLAEKGTGSFPEHTYNIATGEEKSLTIELEGTAYLEVQGEKNGENLISPIEYSPEDSPVKVDVSDKKQVFIKTGNALGTIVKINGEQIDFQTQQATQKLLLNFK